MTRPEYGEEYYIDKETYEFSQFIARTFSGKAQSDIRKGPYGHFARVTNIDSDYVETAKDEIEASEEYDYAVNETGNGLEMEVWTL